MILTQSETETASLLDLESDLASLACQAAIELDNLLLGGNGGREAVRRLADALSHIVASGGEAASPASLLKPATAVVLNRAFGERHVAGLSSIDDLVKSAGDIAGQLRAVAANPEDPLLAAPEQIRNMRATCLAVSRSAWASESSPYDRRPEHPFRR